MLQKSYETVNILKKGIDCGLINLHCLKPLDYKGILKISKKSKILVVIEDHNQFGGLGSMILAIFLKKPNKNTIYKFWR